VTQLLDGLWRASPFLLIAILSIALRAVVPRTARRPFPLLRELLLILPVVLLYFVAHGLAQVRSQEAMAHAQHLISL
jgi:hypothetical protein